MTTHASSVARWPLPVTTADVCVIALADVFRGDGEILAHPIGLIPDLAAKLAQATFEPDLVLLAGEAVLGRRPGGPYGRVVAEGHLPLRHVFDVVWSGRRHVIMGAAQLDTYGNQNIASVGPDRGRPRVQLLGYRGAPGNTVNHATTYWVADHTPETFVHAVDTVCGIGYDRARRLHESGRHHEIRRVVTNLATFDFPAPDHRMRLRTLHPGVTVQVVRAATSFEIVAAADPVETSRFPTPHELAVLDQLDPRGLRHREVPA